MFSYDFSDLKEKTAIIIGGFGLIGKAISKGFAKVGSKIIIADVVRLKNHLRCLKNINRTDIHYFPFDITNSKDIDKLISFTLKKHRKIDVLVNCSFPRTKDWLTDVEHVNYESVKENIVNHLGGYYQCTQKVALVMKRQKRGSIINFSSIYGLVAPTFSIYQGTKITSPPAYALIKGGINMMTKYFASYFGKYNVRVNCISPGGVYDGQNKKFIQKYISLTPLGRMANSEDLVVPTLFLASEGSRYITGHNLVVDGGWTAH